MIVSVQHVQKYYGANLVLTDLTLEIKEGDRVGLIGRNGEGKTTLFKMISGEQPYDGGQIHIRKGTKIGCLAQIPDYGDETTVYEVIARGYTELRACQRQIGELEAQMTDPAVYADEAKLNAVLAQYDKARERFEREGGYEMEANIERVANGLGVPQEQYRRPFASLSGGEKTKIGLAALLLEQPDLLLLDEPTNHLDMKAIEWLEGYLRDYAGTVVIISHDRYFLDKVATKVIEIEDGEAFTYHTNYSGYQKEKEDRLLLEFAQYQEQQKKIKKMQETIKRLYDWARRNPQNPKFHRQAASIQKALDRMEKLKRPKLEQEAMELQWKMKDRSGERVVVIEDAAKSFGERTLFQGVHDVLTYGERVFLIGDNGAGKSTLFKLILGQDAPSQGSVKLGSRVEVGYLAQEEAPQDEEKTVLQYFKEEVRMEEGQARGQLARFQFFGPDVFRAVKNLSGGEWSRLRLALLMFKKPNLLLLDEPTNHLDIVSREALEEALDEFPGTLLVISHDRYFINRLASKIWALENGGLTRYLGDFDFYKEKAADAPLAAPAVLPQPPVLKAPVMQEKKGNLFQKAKIEERIAELEAQLKRLDAELLDPVHGIDSAKLTTLSADRDAAQAELDAAIERWMELEA
ncbi:ATPase subunit of ABC transporter with duplicated ATPase domains [Tumebacillus sp. BK434]|uniref:ribosomal protection-like ABC-F family protein n=1 Tax=Tumebacillus sp. BK434 TaxID=2512169 RepID=UPI00104E7587|nr:ABC-F type ribosomal protection protein [Tumebacillus sp. BK434]TCP52895.1 ATPase subunit of ABC transporter with duplicated ATPase domains [Tumebacillus sp. BK434]